MLYSLIAETLKKAGRQWKVEDKLITPDEDDIERVLDAAAARLYNEEVGSRLEKGGLIIEKKHRGHDIYVMVGSFE